MAKLALQFIFCLSLLLVSSPAHGQQSAQLPPADELVCQQSALELFFVEMECGREMQLGNAPDCHFAVQFTTDCYIRKRPYKPLISYGKKSFSAGKACIFLPLRL